MARRSQAGSQAGSQRGSQLGSVRGGSQAGDAPPEAALQPQASAQEPIEEVSALFCWCFYESDLSVV